MDSKIVSAFGSENFLDSFIFFELPPFVGWHFAHFVSWLAFWQLTFISNTLVCNDITNFGEHRFSSLAISFHVRVLDYPNPSRYSCGWRWGVINSSQSLLYMSDCRNQMGHHVTSSTYRPRTIFKWLEGMVISFPASASALIFWIMQYFSMLFSIIACVDLSIQFVRSWCPSCSRLGHSNVSITHVAVPYGSDKLLELIHKTIITKIIN